MIALVAVEFARNLVPWVCGAGFLWAGWTAVRTFLEIAKTDRAGEVPDVHGV